MEAPRQSVRSEAHEGRRSSDAAWGVTGLMAKDILPDDASERRRRGRLCALRAVDRLGLLGEGNLLATLAARPRLRWLADEEGARWAVLAQLGRIGDPGAFEEAVEWALQNRPRPEEAAAHVRRLRPGPTGPMPANPRRANRSRGRRRRASRALLEQRERTSDDARAVLAYPAPRRRKGTKIAWAVAWLRWAWAS
jgi:hypothetical protein